MSENQEKPFVFPKWVNWLLPLLVLALVTGAVYVPLVVGFGFSPYATDVGYAPVQPVPFSHALHAGKLGMDCKFCHTTVDKAAFAAIPATQTCMDCHTKIKPYNPAEPEVNKVMKPLYESWVTGKPIQWVKIHDLPEYSYFNHASHVTKGVSCVSCHGRIDQMEVVYQKEPLSMSWCLDCHRAPEKHIRPKDQVTNLGWKPPQEGDETPAAAQLRIGLELKKSYGIHDTAYMTSCSTCHR